MKNKVKINIFIKILNFIKQYKNIRSVKNFKYRTIIIRSNQTLLPAARFAGSFVGDIKIINTGAEDVKVLDIPLAKNGGSIDFPANRDENNTTALDFVFAPGVAGSNFEVLVLAKVFDNVV